MPRLWFQDDVAAGLSALPDLLTEGRAVTSVRCDELRRLAEAATPGPWAWEQVRKFRDGAYGHDWVTLDRNHKFIAACDPQTVLALLDEITRLRTQAQRAAYIAEHLFAMVPRETWRDTGGDDGQGHYEGEYHAEKLGEEIKALRAALGEKP